MSEIYPPNLSARDRIDRLVKSDLKAAQQIPGVEIYDESPRSGNCSRYLFGFGIVVLEREIKTRGREVGFEEGAIITYFDSLGDHPDWIVHVGRIEADGYVISKWGPNGPVYRHKVWLVPSYYGDRVRYFKFS